eukprot:5835957-Alexandrium_andersonii.AAC.1
MTDSPAEPHRLQAPDQLPRPAPQPRQPGESTEPAGRPRHLSGWEWTGGPHHMIGTTSCSLARARSGARDPP